MNHEDRLLQAGEYSYSNDPGILALVDILHFAEKTLLNLVARLLEEAPSQFAADHLAAELYYERTNWELPDSVIKLAAARMDGFHRYWKNVTEAKQMPYAEYLKTEHWQIVRERALRRARYRCQLCNNDRAILDTHHRSYDNLGKETDSDVIVLCRRCHTTFHEVIK